MGDLAMVRCGRAGIRWWGRSWDLSAVVELGFGAGGAGAGIRWQAQRWELLADTEVGFVRRCRAGIC